MTGVWFFNVYFLLLCESDCRCQHTHGTQREMWWGPSLCPPFCGFGGPNLSHQLSRQAITETSMVDLKLSILPAQPLTSWGQASLPSLPHAGLSPPCSVSHVLGSVLPTQPPTCWGQSSLLSLPRAGVIGMHHYTQHNLEQLKTFQQTNLNLEGKA